jgi:hypothetical protein
MKDRISLPWLWTLALAIGLLSFFDVEAGTATVTCTPPTTNADGTALTNLAGFRFYYGTDATHLTTFVQVANPGTCSNTFPNLANGQWFFSVTSYRADGAESDDSAIVTKTISATPPPPLVPTGPYAYEPTGTSTAPTMSAIGLLLPGATCGTTVRQIGTTKFCQITRAQADILVWPTDRTLAAGLWAKAQ